MHYLLISFVIVYSNSLFFITIFNFASRSSIIKNVCDGMKDKILARVFRKWLTYIRHKRIVNEHLISLININDSQNIIQNVPTENKINSMIIEYLNSKKKVDEYLWNEIQNNCFNFSNSLLFKLIYSNGIIDDNLRKLIWPYLLGFYEFEMSNEKLDEINYKSIEEYNRLKGEWKCYEDYILLNEAKKSIDNHETPITKNNLRDNDSGICSDITSCTSSNSSSIDSSASISILTKRKEPMQVIIKQSPSSIKPTAKINTNKTRFFNFNSNKHNQIGTPVSIMNMNLNEKQVKILGNDKKSTFELHNPRKIFKKIFKDNKISDSVNSIDSLNSSSFLNSFSAKNLLSKFINRDTNDLACSNETSFCNKSLSEDLLKTPINKRNNNNNDIYYDNEYNQLANLLVSSAILRAMYHLNDDIGNTPVKTKIFDNHVVMTNNSDSMTSSLIQNDYEEHNNSCNEYANDHDFSYTPNRFSMHSSIHSEINSDVLQNNNNNSNKQSTDKMKEKKFNIDKLDDFISADSVSENNNFTPDNNVMDYFKLNMHRIDKDVARCDRNHNFFKSTQNLNKIKNIMYT